MKTFTFFSIFLLITTFSIFSQGPTFKWISGKVGDRATIPGYQMNADVGSDGLLHIISSGSHPFYCCGGDVCDDGGCDKQLGYFVYDENGVKRTENLYKGDADWNWTDFNPAIAVTADGNSHIVIRDPGTGNISVGRDLRYRMVASNNEWMRDYKIASAQAGNTLVAIAAADNDHVYLAYAENNGNDVRLLLAGATSATDLGVIPSVCLLGNRFVMKGKNGVVYFASGNDSKVVFSWANAGENVVADLIANKATLTDGVGIKGKPDLYVNNQGVAYVTYGAENSIFFNMFDKNTHQQVLSNSSMIFDFSAGGGNLWTKKYGFGYIAASNDGKVIYSIGIGMSGKGWDDYNPGIPQPNPLPTEYSNGGSFGRYFYSFSTDGGTTWSTQKELRDDVDKNGAYVGTGTRPTVMNYMHGKFLFSYYDAQYFKEYSLGIADFSSVLTLPQLGHDFTVCNMASNIIDTKIPADGSTTFSWYKDGISQVANSTTANSFETSGVGLYQVKVNNIEDQSITIFPKTIIPEMYVDINGKTYPGPCYGVGENFATIYAYSTVPVRDNLSFAWYKDNVIIDGETTNSLFVFENGTYKVSVQEPNCTPVTNTFTVVTNQSDCPPIGIENSRLIPVNGKISVEPNPVDNALLINGFSGIGDKAAIKIFNNVGQLMLSKTVNITSQIILPSSLPAGLYFISVSSGEITSNAKFIKN